MDTELTQIVARVAASLGVEPGRVADVAQGTVEAPGAAWAVEALRAGWSEGNGR